MQIKDMMMTMVVAGLIAFCLSGIVFSLNADYNPGQSVNISAIDSMGSDVNSLNNQVNNTYGIVNGNNTISAGGVYGVIFNGIGNFFKSIFNIVVFPIKWIINIGNLIGIPTFITSALISLILISITFAVLGAILRRTP